LLISFKTAGKSGISKAAVPSLALGLITSKLFILKQKSNLLFFLNTEFSRKTHADITKALQPTEQSDLTLV